MARYFMIETERYLMKYRPIKYTLSNQDMAWYFLKCEMPFSDDKI